MPSCRAETHHYPKRDMRHAEGFLSPVCCLERFCEAGVFQRKLSPVGQVSAHRDPCPLHHAVGYILTFLASGTSDDLQLHTSDNTREKNSRLVWDDSEGGSSRNEKWLKASFQRMVVQSLFYKYSWPHYSLFWAVADISGTANYFQLCRKGSWWTPSWTWANRVSLQQRSLMVSRVTLGILH